jgi:hypothetical protein
MPLTANGTACRTGAEITSRAIVISFAEKVDGLTLESAMEYLEESVERRFSCEALKSTLNW